MSRQYPFAGEPLPYNPGAFSPYCDPDVLYLHYNHYISKIRELNALVLQHRLTELSLEDLLLQPFRLPAVQLAGLKGAAGSVYNHALYFDSLKGTSGPPPLNRLVGVLVGIYGSMEAFKRLILEAAESIPGVGWVWLAAGRNGGPHIAVTQDNDVIQLDTVQPLFVIDLWEHAYLFNGPFDIEKYINTLFLFLDWDKIDARFQKAHETLVYFNHLSGEAR